MMVVNFLSLLTAVAGVSTESMSAHSWIQSSLTEIEIECPLRLEFKGYKYRFYNSCPTKSRSGVIEWGSYLIVGDELVLSDRYVLEGGGSIFEEDAQPFVLVIEEASASSILFRYRDRQLRFINSGISNW